MGPRLERLLTKAHGPAPWYWETFPSFQIGARTWNWLSEPAQDGHGSWPMLVRGWDSAPCFMPGFYTYLAQANEETLLVWRSTLTGSVAIRFYPVTQLEPIEPPEDSRSERDVVLRRASELVQIPRLEPGAHRGFKVRTMVDIEELLLLAHWSGTNESDPALAIYSWRPASGAVTGIRLGAFELEDDDMTIRQWFTDAWGQPLDSASR